MAELGGVAEITQRLGVSRATTEALVNYSGFPAPAGRLARGRVWDLTEVREWAESNGRHWTEPEPPN